MRQLIIIIAYNIILMGIGFTQFVWSETITMSYEEGYLDADIQNASLRKVFEKLSEVYGTTVFVDQAIQDKQLSVRFSNMPIEKAVKRLASPYSTVTVFSQRQGKKGENEFYISDLKVYGSGTGGDGVQYVNVTSGTRVDETKPLNQSSQPRYQNPFSVPPPVPGVHAKGSYGEKAQKAINNKMIESRIKKISYMRAKSQMEENMLRKDITQLKIALSNAEGDDRRQLSADLSSKTRELYNLQKRNLTRIQHEERILRQLQAR